MFPTVKSLGLAEKLRQETVLKDLSNDEQMSSGLKQHLGKYCNIIY